MGRGAQALVNTGHPDSKAINERQASLEHLVRNLQRRSNMRQHRLMESLFRHEYFLESAELEQWIAEQLQQASSEDYGQDHEHLQVGFLMYYKTIFKFRFNRFYKQISMTSNIE